MKWKQFLLVVAVSALSASGTVWIYGKYSSSANGNGVCTIGRRKDPWQLCGLLWTTLAGSGEPIDFTKAAGTAVPAVVHIKTKIPAKKISNQLPRTRGNSMEDWFDQFFNNSPQMQPEQRASGSGVIISEDGYIVTNNHVVSDGSTGVADEITVMLNNKKTL